MKTSRHAVTALLLSMLLTATFVRAEVGLPQKAFAVEDGIVAVRAGVMPGPQAQSALPLGKLRHPTRYFIELVNESPYPLWLEAAWAFPEKQADKVKWSKPVRSGKVPPGGSYWFYSDRLGVMADQPISVTVKAFPDEKRSLPAGAQTAELRFAQPDIDVFLANFPSAFRNSPKDAPAAVISGWHDLPKPRSDVPGTATDAVLAADIQHMLWKSDSTKRFTCERDVLDAAPIGVVDSEMLSHMGADAMRGAQDEQASNVFAIERWQIRSCGEVLVYEVLLSASEKGGTDIMVVDVASLSPIVMDGTGPASE